MPNLLIPFLFTLILITGCGKQQTIKPNNLKNLNTEYETEVENEKVEIKSSDKDTGPDVLTGNSTNDDFLDEETNDNSFSETELADQNELTLNAKNLDHETLPKINDGDDTKHIEHGQVISTSHDKIFCLADRDNFQQIKFNCLENIKNKLKKIKMPCIYEDKFYPHGSVIPVSPGEWIYYRGEVIATEPGIMLVCDDGKLITHEIRER